MPKVTWLGAPGEDSKSNAAEGIVFEKGKAVETDNPRLLAMAAANAHFKVEGYTAPAEEEAKAWPAPSTMSPQHPVVKPGEPVHPISPTEPGIPGHPIEPESPGSPSHPIAPSEPGSPSHPIAPGGPGPSHPTAPGGPTPTPTSKGKK